MEHTQKKISKETKEKNNRNVLKTEAKRSEISKKHKKKPKTWRN